MHGFVFARELFTLQLPLCGGIRDDDLVNSLNDYNGKSQWFTDHGTTFNRNLKIFLVLEVMIANSLGDG